MVLVIPVSEVDLGQAENLAKRIVKLGDELPKIMIVASWGAWWDVYRVSTPLGRAETFKLDFVDETGWPESSNHMFIQSAYLAASRYPNEPWYFMEADTYPLKKGWFQALEEEYLRIGKPYMGVISTSLRMIDGEIKDTGKHMTGTAIYPADFLTRCKSIHYLMRDPWDIEIGPEILTEVHDTNLIAHRWSSTGYYKKDGVIHVGASKGKYTYMHTRPIPDEAVVCHGCKDSSIYALDLPLVMA